MEPEQTVGTVCYTSRYEHGVDDKRRVQIPAKWRPAQAGTELTLIMWPGSSAGTCLRVVPPEGMATLVAEVQAMPNADPLKPVLKRFIGGESVTVVLDKAGRICLPEHMAKEADISDVAVLVGALDRFEIWSLQRFEEIRKSDRVKITDAIKLMG